MSSAPAGPSRTLWDGVAETLLPGRTRDGVLPPLMIVLTIVTGIVDAVAYLRLGHVFVANMTGNVVFLGFAAAGASGLSIAGSLIALGCFLAAGVAAARLAARAGDDRLQQLAAGTAVQTVLFAAAIPLAAAAGSNPGTGFQYGLIVLLALAMGVQNTIARRLAVADLTTTVLTLTLTGIAADSRLAGGSGERTTRRVLSVGAMLLGALIGALLLLKVSIVAPVAVATAVVGLVAAFAYKQGREQITQGGTS